MSACPARSPTRPCSTGCAPLSRGRDRARLRLDRGRAWRSTSRDGLAGFPAVADRPARRQRRRCGSIDGALRIRSARTASALSRRRQPPLRRARRFRRYRRHAWNCAATATTSSAAATAIDQCRRPEGASGGGRGGDQPAPRACRCRGCAAGAARSPARSSWPTSCCRPAGRAHGRRSRTKSWKPAARPLPPHKVPAMLSEVVPRSRLPPPAS